MSKTEIGRQHSIKYRLEYDKLGHQQACNAEHYHIRYWFLWINDDYVGSFQTKQEAINYLTQLL